ncbi:DUF5809 family protein [Halogeometricum limi]|uniref:Uncharacterized protein n=1 Tax=Halogeometricum limi TaxID=555875 RepID=A0A1I6H912_9EURY|nr:DUF5809 family protein [Halogeometricum limi]SFR50787.1 hypothetical protein SAMN04488124_1919 [Halogeometricum limi]
METEGTLAPETETAAREAFEAAGPTAQQVVRETAKVMAFDREEYRERVTSDVVEAARNVLFAERLRVHVGTRAEFEAWTADHPDYEVTEVGSGNVANVVWHAAPFAERVVAATYENEREAAVGTLRRQAFSRLYRSRFEADESDTDDDRPGESDTGDDGTETE